MPAPSAPSPAGGPGESATVAPAVPVGTLAVVSARRPEVEPNNDKKTAQLVALDSVVAGEINDLADVDMFAVVIEKPCELTVMLASASDVVLELRDAAGVVVAKSDRGGKGVTEGVPNFAVVKGRYIVAVKSFGKAAPVDKPPSKSTPKSAPTPADADTATPALAVPLRYELHVAATTSAPRSGLELEPNLDPGSANDLFIGEAASGYVGWVGDVDVWKLSVEGLAARSALDVELSAVEGVTPMFTVTDAVGRRLVQRQGGKNRVLSVRGLVPVVGPNVPPYYFLAIRGERSNPLAMYRLSVVARVLSGTDEMEPNDNDATAQPLLFGQKLMASWQVGDVDSFVIAADATARRLTIVIAPTQDADLVGEVVIPDQPIIEFNHRGQGGSETVDIDLPAGRQAMVRVHGNLKRKTVEGAYEIFVTVAQGEADPMPHEQRAP
ncbi:MAG: hypothetical protein KBG15_03970 [Kofleriaceae bacterium]|nr:hypothetical protein [Kofleriaceae bacterium]